MYSLTGTAGRFLSEKEKRQIILEPERSLLNGVFRCLKGLRPMIEEAESCERDINKTGAALKEWEKILNYAGISTSNIRKYNESLKARKFCFRRMDHIEDGSFIYSMVSYAEGGKQRRQGFSDGDYWDSMLDACLKARRAAEKNNIALMSAACLIVGLWAELIVNLVGIEGIER